MQNKHMNLNYFLALSALYFELEDNQAVSLEDDSMLELVESINEYIPAITPERLTSKFL